MINKSQGLQQTVSAQSQLDNTIENKPTNLMGEKTRLKTGDVLATPVVAENIEEFKQNKEEIHECANAQEELRNSFGKGPEFTPKQKEQLITTLENRFKNTPVHYDTPEFRRRREGIDFYQVRAALEAHPKYTWVLYLMERTGGQPDVWGVEDNNFIFLCSSAESPKSRRNLDWIESDDSCRLTHFMKFLSDETYYMMQKCGKFDINSETWLATPMYIRREGRAKFGKMAIDGRALVDSCDMRHNLPERGWRGRLDIPRVK